MTDDKRDELRLTFHGCRLHLKDRPGVDFAVVDLTVKGLQFLSEEPFDAGEILSMALEMPQFTRAVNLSGRVIWSRLAKDPESWRVGVEFVDPDSKAATALTLLKDEGIHKLLERRIL